MTVFARNNIPHGHQAGSSILEASSYVQGMNVLAAPLLYVMPEMDAFISFNALCKRHCPRYILPNLDGVHHGCSLVDRCLQLCDPELYQHIKKKILQVEIFAFKFVMTLLANMLPLKEVVRVWDAIFAFGIHFNILLVTAHVILLRSKLLAIDKAVKCVRLMKQPY